MEKLSSSIDSSDHEIFGASSDDEQQGGLEPMYEYRGTCTMKNLQQRLENEKENERIKHENDSDASSSSSPLVQLESDKDIFEDSSSSASSCQEEEEDDEEDEEEDDVQNELAQLESSVRRHHQNRKLAQ
jgi:hypothetical protein